MNITKKKIREVTVMIEANKTSSTVTPKKRLRNRIAQKKFRQNSQKKLSELLERCTFLEQRNRELEESETQLKKRIIALTEGKCSHSARSCESLSPAISSGLAKLDENSFFSNCQTENNDGLLAANLGRSADFRDLDNACDPFSNTEKKNASKSLDDICSFLGSENNSKTLNSLLSNCFSNCNDQPMISDCMEKCISSNIESLFGGANPDLLLNGCEQFLKNDITSSECQYLYFSNEGTGC